MWAFSFGAANNHISTTGYGYDAAGNLTQDPTNVPTNTYQWDAEGRMRAIVQNGTTFLTNTYNSLGQLVEADYPGYNAKVLAAFDASGRELGQYNGVGGYWWDQDVWAGGRMLAQEETGVTYFLHANTIGSDTQVTNQAGTVLMDMLYYPWGQVWQTVGSTVDSHFAGFQKSAGPIYQTPNRSYLDSVGRWLTPDPGGVKVVKLNDPQTWNMYAYVGNNPTSRNDPSGLVVGCSSDLAKKDAQKCQEIIDLANKKDKNGSYVNPKLHSIYDRLNQDSRVFTIENSKKLPPGTGGLTTLTGINRAGTDFTSATLGIDFAQVRGTSSLPADKVPGFMKFGGIEHDFSLKLTETFGHEGAHAVYALDNPEEAVSLQLLINDADRRHANDPELLRESNAINLGLAPTETFAQQIEQIINMELIAGSGR